MLKSLQPQILNMDLGNQADNFEISNDNLDLITKIQQKKQFMNNLQACNKQLIVTKDTQMELKLKYE